MILTGCGLGEHAVTIDSHGPAILASCDDRISLMRPARDGWHETTSWPEKYAILEGAAADDQDRIHVRLLLKGVDHHYIVKGTDRRDVALPKDAKLADLGVCGGTVHAVFEGSGDGDARYMSFGTFRGDRWQLDKVADEAGGIDRLGFDGDCRPFIGTQGSIWSKGAKRWVRSVFDPSVNIKSLAADRDHLYVAYEEIRDGVEVGIASAPLVPEP